MSSLLVLIIFLSSNGAKVMNLKKHFVDPKSNFSLFPRWFHNFSQREFPQTNPFFKKFVTYKGVAASMVAEGPRICGRVRFV